jgi:peptide chain release factor subunit 1
MTLKLRSLTPEQEELEIKEFKMKKLIKSLRDARGNGTSMITLVIPPNDQIARYSRMLADEYGTASNIKSRVNRLSVLSAITSTQAKLKMFTKTPPNGLVIYCGSIVTGENKEKKVTYDIEPHKAINTSLYMCDNRFHTEVLEDLLISNDLYGFVIMDGHGTLFGTLAGNTRTTLQKVTVDLPKKHGRGGQSAVRFSRLRTEKRHNYLRKVAELCTKHFITNDRPNVTGIVLAGLAQFKNELRETDMFDLRLKEIVCATVDVSYGMENGFNQAIELSADSLTEIKYIQEKKIICKYFEEIAKDTGMICYGIKETFYALDNGAVDTVLIWEDLPHIRFSCKNPAGDTVILNLSPSECLNKNNFMDSAGQELTIEAQEPLCEWFAEHYRDFGAQLLFVTDQSQEGNQFVQGFGGVGGFLRFQLDLTAMDYLEEGAEKEEEWDWDW